MKWELRLFDARPGAAKVPCRSCGRDMYLPPSKIGQRGTCSVHCRDALSASANRSCETCGATFRPRLTQLRAGQGRFCSQKCNAAGLAAVNAPEVKERAKTNLRAAYAAGRVSRATGAEHPAWKGGPRASRLRRCASGAEAAALRAYRRRNPERAREWGSRRNGKRVSALPTGTVQRIGDAQRWLCAICRAPIRRRYHADHIMPLARGGEHAGRNIQLLCPSCNSRKQASDPVDYMRSLGRLL